MSHSQLSTVNSKLKFKFKVQPYQTDAVESVVDCFAGQMNTSGLRYRTDPGVNKKLQAQGQTLPGIDIEQTGFKNADISLSESQILKNIRDVQRKQKLFLSDKLESSAGCKVNLDVEMETGTGKTYCYIKTFFELNKRYGWSKFIVVVPSIAIREGVLKALETTAEHFFESYCKKIRFFAYNSKQLHHLESFSSDAGINVMVINIQAFNASGKDNRRIYEELDDFQSRKPIDVIAGNHPILILDEPQKMEGEKTLTALAKFNPLMILRYSATHRTTHNKIYRLDALDAYNQKLVKKIAVRGIAAKNLVGTNAYLYLESIEISSGPPVARIELEVRLADGSIKRQLKRLENGRNLFIESNKLDQYKGFVITQIDANLGTVEFINGVSLNAGDATCDITDPVIRRIQIREAIMAHFEKEQPLFAQGIKVLSLFFIDEVVKYRDYGRDDKQGEYARIFEEEYEQVRDEYLNSPSLKDEKYLEYLRAIQVRQTHNGYFSIDKKSKKLIDPKIEKRGDDAGLSEDVDAYDLILKDKELLLSFEEPVRFIFSHSALREGWDNPNVFVMCMLKHSDNKISRRQEVGRGLRISVNQHGDRMDDPATVHDVNILTVVASESYKDFVENLQREINDTLSARPRKLNDGYFIGKEISTETGTLEITKEQANIIEFYLIKNGYVDQNRQITEEYQKAKAEGKLAPFERDLSPYAEQIINLIECEPPEVTDDRKSKTNPLNANFEKKEFKALWDRINKKMVYRVEFDSDELVKKSIQALDHDLRVNQLQYFVESGDQTEQLTEDQLKSGKGFELTNTSVKTHNSSIHSMVTYDLLGKIAENTLLTRKTVAEILGGINPSVFEQFKLNPEHFIAETSKLINEQKATIVIEQLSYDTIAETYDVSIFTADQTKFDLSKAGNKLKKHIFDYAILNSNVERKFIEKLDNSNEVVVYAKLPRGFLIPTPVGNYNPDWAISFKEGSVEHIYFIAETKGSLNSLSLRGFEKLKLDCAEKFFEQLNSKISSGRVKYQMVGSYEDLMNKAAFKNQK